MKIVKTKIKNLIILKSQIFKDNRGFLRETFKKNVLNKSFPFDITSFQKMLLEVFIFKKNIQAKTNNCNSW